MAVKIKDGDGATKYIVASGTGTLIDPYIPIHGSSSSGAQPIRIDQYLSVNGDGTGASSAIGDYSSTEGIMSIQPPPGTVYRIARLLVYIEDSGSFDSGLYGNGTALTNGIVVRVVDDSSTISDLTAGKPIKENQHWGRACYDTNHSSYGSGNESLAVRWTFTKAGVYIRLDGDNNERLEAVFNDSLTALVDHTFLVQGYVE
jgi:hypothetical protein